MPTTLLATYRTAMKADGKSLHLAASLDGDRILFKGGKYGEHSVSATQTSLAGINAHWEGYCATNNNGRAKPRRITRAQLLDTVRT